MPVSDEQLLPKEADKEDPIAKKNAAVARKLILASVICLIFMIVEIVGGFLAHSLALMSDASHILSDLASNLIGLFAIWLASQKGSTTMSFGYHRAEILGALGSVFIIWGVTAWLLYEAVDRVVHPAVVDGQIMSITALIGVAVNLILTQVLQTHSHGIGHTCHGHDHGHAHDHGHSHGHAHHEHGTHTRDEGGKIEVKVHEHHDSHDHSHDHAHDHSHDHGHQDKKQQKSMNLDAAYIHALGDLFQSLGVLIAALCIWYNPEWHLADPICTLIFSAFVMWTTTEIVREAVNILMEGTPEHIDLSQLQLDLSNIKGVVDVHDLHVWSLSVGSPALAVHIVAGEEPMARSILESATAVCQSKYDILHTTIQVDFSMGQEECGTTAHIKCHD
ncbi:unnamed protein product [Vitrella brassicaformis CCMP3155]|uniref:Cation efflux protein cytoplasmic domain-containing protein n=2 Tax=Vitrella brassicaformis TaxID=1169539 RepID=A0A0G4F4L4_VITBC|nr:unnamed protein product [Vitrella brassicaformis CCMP3155]|mmetsp:Transcript_32020/g.79400  ORF Transcript_32020/g.79400 Transcript_32020/m.79400 type:complete len:390 (+) Transcript_32020:84-1253(+)|eukprot:CEM07003.1 unnamed protein product [Vitrella brassicaformis CCMP3155]